MFKTLYEFSLDKPALLLKPVPGLEKSLVEELSNFSKIRFRAFASGYLALYLKDFDEILHVLMNVRGSRRFSLLIGVYELDGKIVDRSLVKIVAEETKDIFQHFAENFVSSSDFVAFRGFRRNFLFINELDYEHDVKSIEIAKIFAEKYLGGLNLKVDLESPSIEIFVELVGNRVFVSWDLLGDVSKGRVYRRYTHPAGLQPFAAVNLLYFNGFDESITYVYDPMCGAGTIPIEVLAISHRIPIFVEVTDSILKYFLEKFSYNERFFVKLVRESISVESDKVIYGSDISEKYLNWCLENLSTYLKFLKSRYSIELKPKIKFLKKNILFDDPQVKADLVAVNPPYGIKLTRYEFIPKLYRALADFSKRSGARIFKAYTPRIEEIVDALKYYWGKIFWRKVYLGDLLAYSIFASNS